MRRMESLSQECGWDDGLGTAQGAERAWAGHLPGLVPVRFGASKVCPGVSPPATLGGHQLLHHTALTIGYRGENLCLTKARSQESGGHSECGWRAFGQLHNGNLCLSAAGTGPGSRDKGHSVWVALIWGWSCCSGCGQGLGHLCCFSIHSLAGVSPS